ncbi:ABC transporter ATP-binding protein [Puniceicoccaceae bacterium K14]|nr:ABC transporter ATP-binding protein [Puniceicoccaceae bacterium K14]
MAFDLKACYQMLLLNIENLEKKFRSGKSWSDPVLTVDSFSLEAGQQIAVKGPSGCGKTTFLHLIAGIATATSGTIRIGDSELTDLSEAERDQFRAKNIGYVFQSFHLMRDFTCLENVELGMSFGATVDQEFARSLLVRVGLEDRLNYRASELSIGQQQRVAVARALANRPKLVLADEPTGSLDEVASRRVVSLLQQLCQENGATLLLVSHDRQVVDSFEEKIDFANLNKATLGKGGGRHESV